MHRYMILCLSVLNRYHISIHMLTINLQVSYTLFHIIRILNVEVIGGTAEAAGEGEVTEALRNTRINGVRHRMAAHPGLPGRGSRKSMRLFR